MLQEIEKFFVAFIGDEYTTVLRAFLIGVCLMLVYGLLIRPILNLCVGKNKGFFDFIMIALILIVGVKVAFPALFVADGFTQDDLDSYYEQGYSDGKDYGEGIGYDQGYEDALKENGITSPDDTPEETEAPETSAPDEEVAYPEIELRFDSEADLKTYLENKYSYTVYSADYQDGFYSAAFVPYSSLQVDLVNADVNNYSIDGTPYCVVNNTLYYSYNKDLLDSNYSDYASDDFAGGYFLFDIDGNSLNGGLVCTHSDDLPAPEPYENEDGLMVYASIEQFKTYNEYTWLSDTPSINDTYCFRGDALVDVSKCTFAKYEEEATTAEVVGTPYCLIGDTTYYFYDRYLIKEAFNYPSDDWLCVFVVTSCNGYCTDAGA